jgi:hypothetical protein
MKIFFFFTLFLALFVTEAGAQPRKFRSIGALVGYGHEFTDNIDYRIWFNLGDYSQSWKAPRKKVFVGWYAEPQFNLVKTNTTKDGSLDYEFGLNLGLRNYFRIGEQTFMYLMLGSGPHYVSAEMERQANGFIFSDNLAAGCFLPFSKVQNKKYAHPASRVCLNLQFGVRHISNANLKLPNRGVNAYVFRIGLSRLRLP